MIVLLLASCSVFQPLDGTWLFQFEREATLSGDCASEDSGGGTTTYEGTNNVWVEAYSATGGQVVIVLDDPLIGTLNGGNVEASYKTATSSRGVESSDETVLEAVLSGGAMAGTLTQETRWSGGGSDYRCTSATDFTADRVTSSPDSYVRD